MRGDQIAAIGKDGIGPSQLQGGDLNHGLTDGHARHVLGDPGGGAGLTPGPPLRGPLFVAHQTGAFLVADLDAGGLREAQLHGGVIERHRAHPNADLVIEGVARKAKGVLVADQAKPCAVVVREAMPAIGDASAGHQLGAGRELAGGHPSEGGHRLPGAAGVVGIHGPAEERFRGRRK